RRDPRTARLRTRRAGRTARGSRPETPFRRPRSHASPHARPQELISQPILPNKECTIMRKSSILGTALAAALTLPTLAPAADYAIDIEGAHAFIQFRIQHLGYSWLYGRFNEFDGKFTYDEKNPSANKV